MTKIRDDMSTTTTRHPVVASFRQQTATSETVADLEGVAMPPQSLSPQARSQKFTTRGWGLPNFANMLATFLVINLFNSTY